MQQQTMTALFYEASMCQRENVISSPFSFSLTLKREKEGKKIKERQGDANMCFILFFFLIFLI